MKKPDSTARLYWYNPLPRVQKFSSSFYVFRHHLETNVEESNELKGVTWKRIQTINYLKGVVKIRINHLGIIVSVGEY